jgi:hypothetical protein
LSKIAERLFNVWRRLAPRDIDGDLFWWKKEDYPQQGACGRLHKGENWIYEVDLGETFSCGQTNSMRIPYETVSAATAGTSHGFVSCAPYATIVDSRNQTIGRRYNPEMIQIRKLVDWIFSERSFGF